MGMFDDLVPADGKNSVVTTKPAIASGGMFADLLPAAAKDWGQYATWGDALKEIRKLPEGEQPAAMKAWASQTVAKERAQGGIGVTVDDFVRRLARGTPVGSWADEGNALISSGLGIAPYDQQLAYERAKDEQGDASATKLGSLPIVGDVTTAGLTKLAGGIASAPVSPAVRVAQGTALLPATANAAATGAAYGGLYGTGEGETTGERLGNTAKGAAIGTALGASAPPVGRALGNAAEWLASKWRGLPAELQPIGKDATQRLARAATDDNLVANYPRLSQELGSEGMLMDMGPNLRGQASAIANQPGQGQTTIRDALSTRAAGARNRIEGDINNAFGPEQNLVQLERNTVQAANAAADPFYKAFEAADIPMTPNLAKILRESQVWGAVPEAVKMARGQSLMPRAIDRLEPDPMSAMTGVQRKVTDLVPTARELDYVKRALDAKATKAFENGDAHLGNLISNTAERLRNEIDSILSPSNPAASPYAKARALAGDGKQFQEGLSDGSGVFSRPKTHSPDQVADDLANATPTYEAGYRAGARGDLSSMMNDAGTQFGPSGDKAVRKGMWSTNAERKVQQLARNQRAADQLLRRRDAESTFGETNNAVTANSATSARLQAQKEFPNAAENQGGGESLATVTLPGLIAEGGKRAVNAMVSGAKNERIAAMAENAARVLSATRMDRDVYFRGLEKYLNGQGMSAQQAQRISNAVEAMVISSTPTAAGSVSSKPQSVR